MNTFKFVDEGIEQIQKFYKDNYANFISFDSINMFNLTSSSEIMIAQFEIENDKRMFEFQYRVHDCSFYLVEYSLNRIKEIDINE